MKSLPEHRTGYVNGGGVRIFYRRFGKPGATPIIIVHGLSFFSYDWMDVAARLADDREVVAIDMRGFGESDESGEGDYGMRSLAADVIAVLDGLAFDRAVLMGHSMGGRVCLATTEWYSDRVAALVCLDFAPDLAPAGRRRVAESIGRQPDEFASLEDAMRYHGVDPETHPGRCQRFVAFLEKTVDGYRLKRDLHYRNQFRDVLETGRRRPATIDFWDMVAHVDKPFLVLRGRQSDLLEPETLEKVTSRNATARTVEIAGTHDLALTNPDGVSDAVEGFLAAEKL